MLHLKEKILSLYTKRLVKTLRVARVNVGFQQAQSMGILYSAESPQKHEAVRCFATQLNKLGKKVARLCYAVAPLHAAQLDFPTITPRDLQLWGTITHAQAQDFVNTSFDYLYQVDLEGHPMLDYLLAKSQAKCRVGYYDPSRAGLFEMMVKFDRKTDGNDIDDLIVQMIHYTQLLRVP
jgi:hypothetical protein